MTRCTLRSQAEGRTTKGGTNIDLENDTPLQLFLASKLKKQKKSDCNHIMTTIFFIICKNLKNECYMLLMDE